MKMYFGGIGIEIRSSLSFESKIWVFVGKMLPKSVRVRVISKARARGKNSFSVPANARFMLINNAAIAKVTYRPRNANSIVIPIFPPVVLFLPFLPCVMDAKNI